MSKKGHVPMRMCIGCRGKRTKAELVRFVQGPQGAVLSAGEKPIQGRGFYLCPEVKCLKKAQKKLAWVRSLEAGGSQAFLGMKGTA